MLESLPLTKEYIVKNSLKLLAFCSMILSNITYTMENQSHDNTEKDAHLNLEKQFSYLNDLWNIEPPNPSTSRISPRTSHPHNPQSPRFYPAPPPQAGHQNIPGINQRGTYYPAPSGTYYNASALPYYPVAHNEWAERSLKCSEAALCVSIIKLSDENPSELRLKDAKGHALEYINNWTKDITQQKPTQQKH